jgi:hypothetical protein
MASFLSSYSDWDLSQEGRVLTKILRKSIRPKQTLNGFLFLSPILGYKN